MENCWGSIGSSHGMQGIVSNINHCSRRLSKWNRDNRRALSKDIRIKRKELQVASSSIRDGAWDRIRNIEAQLDSLLHSEEVYWKQRARIDWLKEGDRNTRFFHLKALERKTRNRINGLLTAMEFGKRILVV